MATWIHNADESILVEADVLESHLANGWSVELAGVQLEDATLSVDDDMTEAELEALIEEESQDDNES